MNELVDAVSSFRAKKQNVASGRTKIADQFKIPVAS
jgi:hypothetical protein